MNSITKSFNYNKKLWGVSLITNIYTSFQGLDLVLFEKATKGKLISNSKVVDLGCGAGNIAGYLQKNHKKWNITGIDISENALRVAKNNYKEIKFLKSSAENISIKNLDLIYAFDTLEHFDNLSNVIKNAYSNLKNGGIFYTAIPLEKQFPTIYFFLNLIGWQGKRLMSGHINIFNSKELVNLFQENGFKLVEKRYSYHFLMSIFDVVFYLFQTLIGKSIAFESTVSQTNNFFLKIIKNTISLIGYFESTIFSKFVGGKGHFLFVKVDKNDFFSSTYPLTVSEDYQMKWGLKKVLQPRDLEIVRLFKKLDFKNAKKILDFGSANGIWLERILAGTKKNGIGIDISQKLIDIANNRNAKKGKYYLTGQNWPIAKNSFDFCYSFDTFEHIKDKEKEIVRLSQSIKKGGKILIYTLNPNNKYTIDWLFESLGSDYMYKRADHDKKLFIDPKDLGKLFQKHGFSNFDHVLYDGPMNLTGRVLGFILAKLGLNEINDFLIRMFYPLNNFIDGLFLKKGYSNGYFLWATKTK